MKFASRNSLLLLLILSVLLTVYYIIIRVDLSGSKSITSPQSITKSSQAEKVGIPDMDVPVPSKEDECTCECTYESSSTHQSGPSTSIQADPVTPHQHRRVRKKSRSYLLAVLVLTAPANQDRREMIRNTWKNGYKGGKFYVKFVIGVKNLEDNVLAQLQEENSFHNDLLLLPDIEDYYQNLGHKVLDSLVWFDKHVNYSYLLKCDDDTFVMLDKMEEELRERDHSRGFYWGYFVGNNYPLKKGIWAETNWKFCDTYFPYAYGGGYVLSADVVHRIAANAGSIIVYNSEDVSVGAWTVIYDIERRHDVRFDTGTERRDCKNNYLVFHKHSIHQMSIKHEQYVNFGVICTKEEPSFVPEQEYNWNMPPSRCYQKDYTVPLWDNGMERPRISEADAALKAQQLFMQNLNSKSANPSQNQPRNKNAKPLQNQPRNKNAKPLQNQPMNKNAKPSQNVMKRSRNTMPLQNSKRKVGW